MATIEIQKRIRAVNTDDWGTWSLTTDAPPYTNTDLVEYRSIDSTIVTVEDLTSNVTMDSNTYKVTGDGVFDKLMETLNTHIEAQYKAQRLKASDVASVYVGVSPTVLTESIKLLLQRKNSTQQLKVLEAQEALYVRQREAFDDNKYQKLFESQLNYNGMVFQDADTPDVLDVALENKVNDVFNRIITSTGSRTDAVTQNEVNEMPEI